MFSYLWRKTKEIAIKHTKIFIVVMFLNQLLFFGLCLNPICLVAAMPHVLIITVIVGFFYDKTSKQKLVPVDNLSQEEFVKFKDIPKGSWATLNGSDHYNFLMDGVKSATNQLLIMSGWISDHIIDDAFISLLSRKLEQGVSIYIGYGYQDSQGNHNSFGSQKMWDSIARLENKYPNKIMISKYATHEKLLVIDERVAVIGSANWLSNRRYKNSERSVIITDPKFVRSELERARELIEFNHIPF